MKEKNKKKIVKWFWILVAAPFVLVFLLLLLVGIFAKIPSFEELEHPDNKLATQVIAENGEVLATFHIENRTYVSYDELPPHLVNAAGREVRGFKGLAPAREGIIPPGWMRACPQDNPFQEG